MLPPRTFRRWVAPLVALVLALCAVNGWAQTAGPPYSKKAIVGMLKGEVSPKRVAVLARQRGIDFQITSEVESELRRAGATDALLAALRELAPPAEVFEELLKLLPVSNGVQFVVVLGSPLLDGTTCGLEGLSRSLSISRGNSPDWKDGIVGIVAYDSQGEEIARQAASGVNSSCTIYQDPRNVFNASDVDVVVFVGFAVGSKIHGFDLDGLATMATSTGKDIYVLPVMGAWKPVDTTVDSARRYNRVAWAGDPSHGQCLPVGSNIGYERPSSFQVQSCLIEFLAA